MIPRDICEIAPTGCQTLIYKERHAGEALDEASKLGALWDTGTRFRYAYFLAGSYLAKCRGFRSPSQVMNPVVEAITANLSTTLNEFSRSQNLLESQCVIPLSDAPFSIRCEYFILYFCVPCV